MVKTEDTTAPERDHGARERMRRRTENAAAADNAGEKLRRKEKQKSRRTEKLLLSAKGTRKKGFGFGSCVEKERNNKEGKRGARL
ncbi:unnamed protein product [Linum trigynum]|uniref:Uncharacterized protein n=1 Tax=Linum trigynum TaxID=586398 RepID=A0AAV2GQD4_9ROSI